jgi:hypothetical protein
VRRLPASTALTVRSLEPCTSVVSVAPVVDARAARSCSERLLKFGDALAERVALFDFVVHAPSEGLNLSVDGVEAFINFGEVLVDSCEFANARICESFDETVDVSEAFLDSFFHAIEAVPKIDFCHMLGVYHSATANL